jgi:hypothetical protein
MNAFEGTSSVLDNRWNLKLHAWEKTTYRLRKIWEDTVQGDSHSLLEY